MFGQMMVNPVCAARPRRRSADSDSHTNKGRRKRRNRSLDRVAGVGLLFLLVPGDPDSGAVYVLDRKKETWYVGGLRGRTIRRYSVSQLEVLFRDCNFSISLNGRDFGGPVCGGCNARKRA